MGRPMAFRNGRAEIDMACVTVFSHGLPTQVDRDIRNHICMMCMFLLPSTEGSKNYCTKRQYYRHSEEVVDPDRSG